MTCDERLEKTLNRAGQTISDLPKWYEYDEDRLHLSWNMAIRAERELYSLPEDCGITGTRMIDVLSAHYAKAVDIIDRLEWALENVCGERDYLRSVVCGLCTNFREEGADACETFIVGDGIPEYWSVDDENR